MNLQINRRTLYFFGSIFAGVVLLAGILWINRPRPSERTNISPFETDLIEQLVRGLLRESGIRDAPVCFISFGEDCASPSSAFIARFADCRHPVVCSEGSSVSPPVNRIFEKDTGRPGLVIRIIQFNEFVPNVFDVTVSISNLPRGHDRVVYRISHIAGDWIIKSRKPG